MNNSTNGRQVRAAQPARPSRPRQRRGATARTRTGGNPLITVFGSSQACEGDKLYAAGVAMGELLGRAGFEVMTGGYQGVMEAVSRGARAAGAHVIGVTMGRFKDRVNHYVMDEIRTVNFYERFGWLVNRADGYVALSGGIGTLAEVTFTWQELLLQMVPARPLVLVGTQWRGLYRSLTKRLIPMDGLFDPLTLVNSPAAGQKYLVEYFGLNSPSRPSAGAHTLLDTLPPRLPPRRGHAP